MSPAQEITLGNQVRAWLDHPNPDKRTIRRGQRARRQLIECNLRLVVAVAKKFRIFSRHALEQADLLQEGTIGLARAADKFQPAKGYKFSTYAYWWIRQAIGRLLSISDPIKLPNTATQVESRWTRREPGTTKEDFAAEQQISVARLEEILAAVAVARSVASLDATLVDDGSTIGEVIADERQHLDPERSAWSDQIEQLQADPEASDQLALLTLQVEGATVTEIGQLLGGSINRGKRELQAARASLVDQLQPELREELLNAA